VRAPRARLRDRRRRSDISEVLVHDRVAETLGEDPPADLRVGGVAEPLNAVNASPTADPLRKLEEVRFGVLTRVGERDACIERELFMSADLMKEGAVRRTGDAEESNADLDWAPVRRLRREPSAELGDVAGRRSKLCERFDGGVDERQHVLGGELRVQRRQLTSPWPGARADDGLCELPGGLLRIPCSAHVVTHHAVEGSGHPTELARSQGLLVGKRTRGIGQTPARIQLPTDEAENGRSIVDPREVATAEQGTSLDASDRSGG
jgi:hypothetical protein